VSEFYVPTFWNTLFSIFIGHANKKNYITGRKNKYGGIRNKFKKKTKFFIVLQKPYNENEYVKIGTYNFTVVKDYT
jgi:hypothetical protein